MSEQLSREFIMGYLDRLLSRARPVLPAYQISEIKAELGLAVRSHEALQAKVTSAHQPETTAAEKTRGMEAVLDRHFELALRLTQRYKLDLAQELVLNIEGTAEKLLGRDALPQDRGPAPLEKPAQRARDAGLQARTMLKVTLWSLMLKMKGLEAAKFGPGGRAAAARARRLQEEGHKLSVDCFKEISPLAQAVEDQKLMLLLLKLLVLMSYFELGPEAKIEQGQFTQYCGIMKKLIDRMGIKSDEDPSKGTVFLRCLAFCKGLEIRNLERQEFFELLCAALGLYAYSIAFRNRCEEAASLLKSAVNLGNIADSSGQFTAKLQAAVDLMIVAPPHTEIGHATPARQSQLRQPRAQSDRCCRRPCRQAAVGRTAGPQSRLFRLPAPL